jgi:hypothetical protein
MTDIALPPIAVAPHRLTNIRLALVALAVVALVAAAFTVGRVTSTSSHTGRQGTVSVVAPVLKGVQQPAPVCHLHGPC